MSKAIEKLYYGSRLLHAIDVSKLPSDVASNIMNARNAMSQALASLQEPADGHSEACLEINRRRADFRCTCDKPAEEPEIIPADKQRQPDVEGP